MKKIYTIIPHLFFLFLLYFIVFKSKNEFLIKVPFLIVLVGTESTFIVNRTKKATTDFGILVWILLIIWEVLTSKESTSNLVFYPNPEKVFNIFVQDYKLMITGVFSSLQLLFTAYILALSLGVVLGLLVGWYERLKNVFLPIAKVISPIPPIVYSPYAVALLPNFKVASIFVIFNAIFWSVFINMILSVSTVDQKIMDSAKTLNVKTKTMIFSILLPHSVPKIINGLNITLSTSFLVLTAAEMIGAKYGLGYYVRFYSDYLDYTRVIAGIILIGIVVTFLTVFLTKIEKRIVKWK